MRVLRNVAATSEQTKIISKTRPGTEIIRGAAGSGKTTTALLRLRSLVASHRSRLDRERQDRAVRVLVLTFNATLRGYVEELSKEEASEDDNVNLTIQTFAKWVIDCIGRPNLIEESQWSNFLAKNCGTIQVPIDFLKDEIEYVLGRFRHDDLESYIDAERTGRGSVPRIDRQTRRKILDNIIYPYIEWKEADEIWDWHDLAKEAYQHQVDDPFDIIIIDEAQDFSANQLRAVRNHLHENYSLTIVIDATQRIYPRGYTWSEVGIKVQSGRVHSLNVNYRNTKRIARLAQDFVSGLPRDPDSALPDPEECAREGQLPSLIASRFRHQCEYAINYILTKVNLENESVAFLHPKGGGWFSEIRRQLRKNDIGFVDLSRRSDWPQGDENVGLSTLHSSKGLEFDHVIIIGLNMELLPFGEGEDDDRMQASRRLLAMGISRARIHVILGYKPEEASALIDYASPGHYEVVTNEN